MKKKTFGLFKRNIFILGYFVAYRISEDSQNQDCILPSQEQCGWQKYARCQGTIGRNFIMADPEREKSLLQIQSPHFLVKGQVLTLEVQSETGPHTLKTGRDPRKRQTTLAQQVAGLISKGNLHTRLVLSGHRTVGSLHQPAILQKFTKMPYLGSVMYTMQCISAASGIRKTSKVHIPRQERGVRSL